MHIQDEHKQYTFIHNTHTYMKTGSDLHMKPGATEDKQITLTGSGRVRSVSVTGSGRVRSVSVTGSGQVRSVLVTGSGRVRSVS